jgi:hypothetical protein
MTPSNPSQSSPFNALRQFVRRRPDVERCELCSLALAPEHAHLLELEPRRIVCSCDPCAILFSSQEGARFRRIPREVHYLPGFRMTEEQWEALRIPINLAFFVHNSHTDGVVAYYPSPTGAIEALLPLETWPGLVEQNPSLRDLRPDVEALLVNRVGDRRDHFRAPIDVCYKVVGLIRARWRGLSGGAEVWEEVSRFFAELKGRASAGGRDDA